VFERLSVGDLSHCIVIFQNEIATQTFVKCGGNHRSEFDASSTGGFVPSHCLFSNLEEFVPHFFEVGVFSSGMRGIITGVPTTHIV
jgi:hypothetical protein